MTKCTLCNKNELIPFICRYCGLSFCAEHRIPESHNCSIIGAKVISMKRITNKKSGPIYVQPSPFRTSRTELLHLGVGILVLFIIESIGLLRFGTAVLISIAAIIIISFTLHEIAHKLTAQYYGFWSEFRIQPFGTLISLLTAFSPFKIIAPGAVVIFGSKVTIQDMGKIALAGPLTNIIQILVFVFLSQSFPILWFAAAFNADLAFFNLLPLSILDGRKVFIWNKKAWASIFVITLTFWIILRVIL